MPNFSGSLLCPVGFFFGILNCALGTVKRSSRSSVLLFFCSFIYNPSLSNTASCTDVLYSSTTIAFLIFLIFCAISFSCNDLFTAATVKRASSTTSFLIIRLNAFAASLRKPFLSSLVSLYSSRETSSKMPTVSLKSFACGFGSEEFVSCDAASLT